MNFIPHSELLLGQSFKRLEIETQMSDKKAKEHDNLLAELTIIKNKHKKIQGSQASLSITACALGLGSGLAVGSIPWFIFMVVILNYSSNIISNIILMILLAFSSLIIGLLLATFVGKFMFNNIMSLSNSGTEKKLAELNRQKQLLIKNINFT